MKKNRLYHRILSILLSLILSGFTVKNVYAHSLASWTEEYSVANVWIHYFYLQNHRHVDGSELYYHFTNNASENVLDEPTQLGITKWIGLIHGTKTILGFNAHVNITYNNEINPGGKLGETVVTLPSENNYHIRRHRLVRDASITIFHNPNTTPSDSTVMAHELGHLWGIGDIYTTFWGNLFADESLYGGTSTLRMPTRNDRNALRIGIEDYWYETETVWRYNVNNNGTVQRVLRADVDFNEHIDSADARLILRYSVDLENFSDLQIKLADVTGDGLVTAEDARAVTQYAVGSISKFPADMLI